MEKSNFFITTFEKIETNKLGWIDIGDSRTVGYYNDFDIVDVWVKSNGGDIYEYLYNYAIVEEIEQGIYPMVLSRYFYKYNEETKNYERIEEPKEFEHYCNFALG